MGHRGGEREVDEAKKELKEVERRIVDLAPHHYNYHAALMGLLIIVSSPSTSWLRSQNTFEICLATLGAGWGF